MNIIDLDAAEEEEFELSPPADSKELNSLARLTVRSFPTFLTFFVRIKHAGKCKSPSQSCRRRKPRGLYSAALSCIVVPPFLISVPDSL
jgi:hypothetical protein